MKDLNYPFKDWGWWTDMEERAKPPTPEKRFVVLKEQAAGKALANRALSALVSRCGDLPLRKKREVLLK